MRQIHFRPRLCAPDLRELYKMFRTLRRSSRFHSRLGRGCPSPFGHAPPYSTPVASRSRLECSTGYFHVPGLIYRQPRSRSRSGFLYYICISYATIYRPNDTSSRYWQYRIVSISSRKISKFRYIVIVSISFQYRRNDVDLVYLFSFL